MNDNYLDFLCEGEEKNSAPHTNPFEEKNNSLYHPSKGIKTAHDQDIERQLTKTNVVSNSKEEELTISIKQKLEKLNKKSPPTIDPFTGSTTNATVDKPEISVPEKNKKDEKKLLDIKKIKTPGATSEYNKSLNEHLKNMKLVTPEKMGTGPESSDMQNVPGVGELLDIHERIKQKLSKNAVDYIQMTYDEKQNRKIMVYPTGIYHAGPFMNGVDIHYPEMSLGIPKSTHAYPGRPRFTTLYDDSVFLTISPGI